MIRSIGPARRCALLAVLCLAALAACSSDEEKLKRHLERGQAYRSERKYDEALIEFRSALQLDPKSAPANFAIAETLSDKEDYVSALFFYRETRRLDPSRTDAAIAEAGILIGGQAGEAGRIIDAVLEKEPTNALAYARRAEIELAKRDIPAALTAAMTASELAPDDPLPRMHVGRAHQMELQIAMTQQKAGKGPGPTDADYEKTIAAFDQAIALAEKQPKSSDQEHMMAGALFERARVLASWPGHEGEAEPAYRKVVEFTAPSDDRRLATSAILSTTRYARAAGNADLEEWATERLLAIEPDRVEVWEELAAVTGRKGGSADAVYARMIETIPKSGRAHVAYAGSLARAGKSDEAVAHLQKVADEGLEPAVTLSALADLYTQLGRLDDAARVVDRLQREHPDEPGTIMAKAQRAVAQGRLADAATALRDLAGKHDSDDVQHRLAWVEFVLGDFQAAAQAANHAIELHGGSWPEAERVRAQIRAATHDWTGALTSLRAVEQGRLTLSASEQVLAANALYQLGSEKPARAILDRLLALPEPPLEAVTLFVQREGRRDPAHARELLAAADARSPGNPEVLAMLVDLDVQAKKAPEALARLDAAIAKTGDAPAALYALRARVRAVNGDLPGAFEDATFALSKEPGRQDFLSVLIEVSTAAGRRPDAAAKLAELRKAGKLQANGTDVLARLYTDLGREEEAIALFDELLKDPTLPASSLPGVKNDLAYLLAKRSQDLDRALDLAQQAQAGMAESVDVADTLGLVYFQKGLYEPALRQYEYAIELAENAKRPTGSFHYRRGTVLQKLGRPDEAAEAFEKSLAVEPKSPDAAAARSALAALKASQSASR